VPIFSKLISVLSIAAAVFGALNSADVLAVLPHNVAALVTVLATVTAALSHSLQGTGGK
jgi:hypothetical protein